MARPLLNNGTLVWNNSNGIERSRRPTPLAAPGLSTIASGAVRDDINSGGSLGSGLITIAGTGSSNTSSIKIWAASAGTLSNNFVLNSIGVRTPGAINMDGGPGQVTLNGSITLAGSSRIGIGGSSWNGTTTINGQVTGSGVRCPLRPTTTASKIRSR